MRSGAADSAGRSGIQCHDVDRDDGLVDVAASATAAKAVALPEEQRLFELRCAFVVVEVDVDVAEQPVLLGRDDRQHVERLVAELVLVVTAIVVAAHRLALVILRENEAVDDVGCGLDDVKNELDAAVLVLLGREVQLVTVLERDLDAVLRVDVTLDRDVGDGRGDSLYLDRH